MTRQQTAKEVDKQRKYSLRFEPAAVQINGDLSFTYLGDGLGHDEGKRTHFSMPKCNEKLYKIHKATSINLSWRPYVDRTDASQAADTLERAQTPPMGTTYGLYKSKVEKKYNELLPLLVLLFISDLKSAVHSAESQKTGVPADKIKSIPDGTEPSPAGSQSPGEVVLQERMTSPGDKEDPGQRNT